MAKTTKLLSLTKARERINAIKRVPLEREEVSIYFIKSKILPLIMGHTILTPPLNIGTVLYRARVFESDKKPKEKKELSCPPEILITKNQRANRAAQTRFYSSTSYEAAISEVKPLPNMNIAISSWVVKKRILLGNVGYTFEVLKNYHSSRNSLPSWRLHPSPILKKPTNELIYNFLGSAFTQEVTPGSEHLYKISVAIAECMIGAEITAGDSEFQGSEVGGLIYPSLAKNADADNIALMPGLIETGHIEIQAVDFIHIEQNNIRIKLDYATSFTENGQIEWKK